MRRKIAALVVFAVAVAGTFIWIETAVRSAPLAAAGFSERWGAAEEAIRSGTFREGPQAAPPVAQ
jgi:hypothetical protein